MICPNPECSGEMQLRRTVRENYFLIFSTRAYTYEWYECSDCGYKTKEELVQEDSWAGFSDWKKDEDS